MTEMDFQAKIRAIASRMGYPHTPDIAGSVTAHLHSATRPRFISKAFAWSLTAVLVLIASLMLIPTARAAIIEFIQIGIVRIFPHSVEPTIEPIRTATAMVTPPVIATSIPPTSDLLPILDKIAGKTTLTNAQRLINYSILLPTYPPGLGEPDLVFVQDADGVMTILVWLEPQNPDKVLMSLHFIPSGSWAINKMGPKVIQETQVDGQHAIWAEGPYPLRVYGPNDIEFTRLIDGHVLIWESKRITYRLETDQSLDEAIKIAESLKPIASP